MNTADRTIGQIDYAVRRRFAFIACEPERKFCRLKKTAKKFGKSTTSVHALFVKNDNDAVGFYLARF